MNLKNGSVQKYRTKIPDSHLDLSKRHGTFYNSTRQYEDKHLLIILIVYDV